MTPTQRSAALLRRDGFHVDVAERWNAFARVRQDAFGFVDLWALRAGELLAVQTTSRTNVPARLRKIKDSPLHLLLLSAGVAIVVHGWAKDKRGRWQVRVVSVDSPRQSRGSFP